MDLQIKETGQANLKDAHDTSDAKWTDQPVVQAEYCFFLEHVDPEVFAKSWPGVSPKMLQQDQEYVPGFHRLQVHV